MKTRLFRIVVLLLPLMALLTGCKTEKFDPDRIVIVDDITKVVFTPGSAEIQTVSFNTTADWTIAFAETDWVEITPLKGSAGDGKVTIRIVGADTDVKREISATISAGLTIATFQIIREAGAAPTEIRITAPQKRVPLGGTAVLEIETVPENAVPGTVVWSSSDDSVLSIDQQGEIMGKTVGTAVVTATAGKLSAQYTFEVTEAYTTDGTGRSYSFEDLSSISFSGVQAVGEGVYLVASSIVIAEEDVLALGDATLVKIGNEAEVQILGMLNFLSDEKVTVQPADGAVPAPLYFTGGKGGGKIRNVNLVGWPIRYFGSELLIIEKCEFTGGGDKLASINLGGSGAVTVSECRFVENGQPAITGGSNMVTPLIFKDNYLYKNSKNVTNRPQINVTSAGNRKLEIKNNTIIGPAANTTNGGIAVSNLLGNAGTNEVLIEGNKVSDCRYGITTNGTMDVRIINNVLENNKWDPNPMTGGSGVSIYNSKGGQKVYMSGNTIKGHLWGITNIGAVATGKGAVLNLGNKTAGADYNPGGNVFSNNGNGGVLYDLYNNSPMTVYAQGNKWNVAVQDEASIEQVIVHKKDNPQFGEVIFMPAAQ